MNLYVQTMNDVIDYIEENISEPLTLSVIAQEFFLSEFHFSRLFKMVTGRNVKQYILGRKLAAAAVRLKSERTSITEIAYDLGFEFPEVFSRNFKKFFGMSPAFYRNGCQEVAPTQKASVYERDIMNFGGVPVLKESYVYLDIKTLYGVYFEADENKNDFTDKLQKTGESFLGNKECCDSLKDDFFYTVVNCLGDESGRYSVFYGGELKNKNDYHLAERIVPAGQYACFSYHGDMLEMLNTFNDDFYRWVLIKEIELSPNGIGMLNAYDRKNMSNVRILVPVKEGK